MNFLIVRLQCTSVVIADYQRKFLIFIVNDYSNLFFFKGTPEELIKHGLTALRETLPNEQELTTKVRLRAATLQYVHHGCILG